MLKNISKIEGIKELNKTDQKQILGGFPGYMGICSSQKPDSSCFAGEGTCWNGQTLWWCELA